MVVATISRISVVSVMAMLATSSDNSANGENSDGRQRRIGERQVEPAAGVEHDAVGIQRPTVEPGLTAHPVDVDVDAVRNVPQQPPARPDQRRHGEQLKQPPGERSSPIRPAGRPPNTHFATRLSAGHRRVGRYPGRDTRRSA